MVMRNFGAGGLTGRRRSRRAATLLRTAPVLLIAALLSCDAASEITGIRRDVDLSSALLRIASGNRQDGEVGTPTPEPLVVQVVDGDGAPVQGAPVVWVFAQGGGVAPGDTAMAKQRLSATDADGRVEMVWSLGTTAGAQEAFAYIVRPEDLAKLEDATSIQASQDWTVRFRASAEPGAPTRLSTSPTEPEVMPGETLTLQAHAEDRYGNDVEDVSLEWTSSNEEVARVDADGLVEALSPGSAEITVRADSVAASTTVTVEEPPLSVAVRPFDVTLTVGDTLRFDASIFDADDRPVDGMEIRWSSSDASILTVDQAGLATARGPGIAAIVASTDGGSGAEQVTVLPAGAEGTAPDRVGDLRVTTVTQTQVTLRWTAVEDGTGAPATYAIRYGSPTIRWWTANPTEVTTAGAAVGRTASYTFDDLEPGSQYQFQLVAFRGTLNQNAVFGSLSNVAGATTEAPEPGPVVSLTVTPASHTFTDVGQTRQLSVTGRDAQGREVDGAEFEFVSSNPSIVSVDAMGRMTARAVGAATVIVSSVCCSAESSVAVQVQEATSEPAVESVTVSPTSRTFTSIGQTTQITARGYDAEGDVVSGAEFTYESTNPSIVSVDDMGRMTARAAGAASIIVSSVCCSAQAGIDVEVDPDDPPSLPTEYNEPSGLSVLFHADGTSKNFGVMASEQDVVVVTDSDAPNGRAIEFRWPQGSGEGFSSHYSPSFGPVREVYYRIVIAVNPDWQHHPGGDKLMYFGHVGKSSSYFLQWRRGSGFGDGDYKMGFQNQSPTGGSPSFIFINQADPNDSDQGAERFVTHDGNYHVYEVHMVAQSSASASDGEFRMWFDGELKEERTNMRWVTSGDVRFEDAQWYPYWGGNGGEVKSVSPYDWLRYGELYISGRP